MHQDIGENICNEKIDYSYISLLSHKTRIGIIGGGEAGLIKARHFLNAKCYVEVIAKSFNDELIELSKNSNGKLIVQNKEFYLEFLKDKHIVIIAVRDKILTDTIKKFCDENSKIYIDSSNFKDGMAIVPVQRNTDNMTFALNTNKGNPKGAVMMINKVKKIADEYDEFIGFMGTIREKAKAYPELKKEILDFISNDDFKKAFDKGESEKLLQHRFSREIAEKLLS